MDRPDIVRNQDNSRICGKGEMAERIRSHDWASSPLGPVETWSDTLVATVNLMLATPNTFSVYWGPKGLLLYNDAYRSLLHEKHPAALGQEGRNVWPEAWPIIGTQVQRAFENEETTNASEVPISVFADGKLREGWFTYSFHPLYENGQVVGVGNPGREDTEIVRTRVAKAEAAAAQQFLLALTDAQRMATSGREVMQITAEMLGTHLQVGRVGFSEAAPDLQSMLFETGWAQGDLRELSGSVPLTHWSEPTSSDFLQGRTVVYPDVRTEPDLTAEVANYEAIGAISVIAVPFLRRGVWRGSLYVNDSKPRQWTRGEVSLVEQIAQRTAEAVERAQAEADTQAVAGRLLLEQEHLRLALEAMHASAFSWDLAADVVSWSGLPPLGRPAEDLAKTAAVYELMHEDDRASTQKIVANAIANQPAYTLEFRAIWPDDSIHWLRSSTIVMRNEQGVATRLLGINADITEQKQAEAALTQTEKLIAVGRLASTIAHEINNPLKSVTNLLYLIQGSSDLSEAKAYVNTAESELRRVSLIANQTLRFHKQSTKAIPAFCYDLIGDSLAIFEGRLLNNKIQVEKRKRAKHPVQCLDAEIRQVLNNLIGNAIDAMPFGGRLMVRSREEFNHLTGKRGLVITVADTGSGMPLEVQKRLFDAFYTTKGIGGTGLGLWVSSEIVVRHEGKLRFRSRITSGKSGTVFNLFLPFEPQSRMSAIP